MFGIRLSLNNSAFFASVKCQRRINGGLNLEQCNQWTCLGETGRINDLRSWRGCDMMIVFVL